MSQHERTFHRDASYSFWHRKDSIIRFCPEDTAEKDARSLSMIDLDGLMYEEYDDRTKRPLVLLELAVDVGQEIKPTSVIQALAQECIPCLPAYCVLYTISDHINPADSNRRIKDISQLRVKRVHPYPEAKWTVYTPEAWTRFLLRLRHRCMERGSASDIVRSMVDRFGKEELLKICDEIRFILTPERGTHGIL